MTTPRLGAPELTSGQATPETTVNEQIRYLESGAGHFIFKDRDLATPPGSPADGDCYLVAASPTGAWSGQAAKIAFRVNTAWAFITAIEGFTAWVNDENAFIGYDGAAWQVLATPSGTYATTSYVDSAVAAATGTYTDEKAQDAVAAALAAGTHTGVTVTYNDGANSLSLAATGSTGTVSSQTGTAYTAVLGDANTYIQFSNASAINFTIPQNSSVAFPVGTVIEIEQAGAGALTVVAGTGTTINSRSSDYTLAGQYAVAFLKKVATNTWTLNGDL